MAEFSAGDRIVKMSGVGAGKYGTVNSVSDGGTLNVTFDGERLPKYCDPERCGKVATNAKFKVGDIVIDRGFPGIKMRIVQDDSRFDPNSHTYAVKPLRGGPISSSREDDLRLANSCARNAGRFELVEHNHGGSFGVYDTATRGYIADDIPLRDALRILKSKGETAEQAKKDLDWVAPSAIDKLW